MENSEILIRINDAINGFEKVVNDYNILFYEIEYKFDSFSKEDKQKFFKIKERFNKILKMTI